MFLGKACFWRLEEHFVFVVIFVFVFVFVSVLVHEIGVGGMGEATKSGAASLWCDEPCRIFLIYTRCRST